MCWLASAGFAWAETDGALLKQHWFEARTAHFHVYSCGPTQEVARVSARLEQFRDAYAALAGAQAVVSPPITVVAFPDVPTMRPFLPLYQDKPVNLAGFFKHGSDENLIVLALSGSPERSLEVIFQREPPICCSGTMTTSGRSGSRKAMAEIYGTFEAGGHQLQIGKPIEHHFCSSWRNRKAIRN